MMDEIKCSVCERTIQVKLYLRHLRAYHLNLKHLVLPCTACEESFSTVPTLQKHWYSKHHVRKNLPPVPHESQQASLKQTNPSIACEQNPSSDSDVIVHVSDEESVEMSFVEEQSDQPSYSHGASSSLSAENTVTHLVSHASDSQPLPPMDSDDSYSDMSSDDSITYDEDEDEEMLESEEEAASSTVSQLPPISSNINHAAASFILGLREKLGVSQSGVSEVMKDSENLIEDCVSNFAVKVDEALKLKDLSLKDVLDVKETVKSCSNVFENIRTIRQQNKHFKEALNVVEPVKVPLGRQFRRVRKHRTASRKTKTVYEEFMYVPISETTEKLINHPDYKFFVENGDMSSNSDVLDSYMKGTLCKKNKVLQEHPDALRFILYYDDLEACSPLKSKAGKHKFGAFYMFLDNIPPKFRANLQVICLVAIVNSNLIKRKKYGINPVLKKIAEDLSKFEKGVILKHSKKKVYGTLIATIGDNLGQHSVAGLKEGFTAHRCCRYCVATYDQVKTMTLEDEDLLRTAEQHKIHVEQVQTQRGKQNALSKEYGINNDSALNELKFYHVIDGMPPDLLHDILEGSLPLTVKKLLRYLLYEREEKSFTLDWLNEAIKEFDYDYCEIADKPSEIKEEYLKSDASSSLHQSGCQMWLLATILPLILSPYVNVEEDHWINFLELLEICRIVFSFQISKWMVGYLRDSIQSYLTSFQELYCSLIPKQHFMLHYPTLILKFGSLANYICTRCEAKHKFFKCMVLRLSNYKNIILSLSTKCQLNQAYRWQKSIRKHSAFGPCVTVDLQSVTYSHLLRVAPNMPVVETNWLELTGIKFIPGRCFIIVGFQDFLPVFGGVANVIVQPDLLFVCRKVKTLYRDVNSASYRVSLEEELFLCRPSNMLSYSVYHTHDILGELAIVWKHCVGGFL